jgi:DNA-directed RNA polymerase specialized sigma24 family protein
MPPELPCSCTLCHTETRLLAELALADHGRAVGETFAGCAVLAPYSSLADLLSHLRDLPPDGQSDNLLRALLALRWNHPATVEPCLVLAFLPMLHRTVHLVTRQQFTLAPEDTAQEALRFFLEFVRSEEMRNRRSHLAFAIARAVKRHVFTWAERESRKLARFEELRTEPQPGNETAVLERLTALRLFLHRCVTSGMLTETELHLLLDFKLNGGKAEEIGGSNGISANAVRQRFKRLLAKLRRAAQRAL